MTTEPISTPRENLGRIADALEMIALFLQVLAEGQAPESIVLTQNGPMDIYAEAPVVETQSGPVKLG